MKFDDFKEKWAATDAKAKYLIIGLLVFGGGFIAINAITKKSEPPKQAGNVAYTAAPSDAPATPDQPGYKLTTVLPQNNRNQGLEDLLLKVDQLNDRLDRIEHGGTPASPEKPPVSMTTNSATTTSPTVDLNSALPPASAGSSPTIPPVNFDQPKTAQQTEANALKPEVKHPATPEIALMDSEPSTDTHPEKQGFSPVLPVNSGIDAIMLSGVDARQAGTTPGLVGGATNSAANIGAPFVTRIKGNAILPNGWKLSDLGDCFLGGSAVAVLSAERAYAKADTLSCISPDGEVWESKVKAYALDADGTLGISCKVVSKQGRVLMDAALAGIASGLGSALSPMAVPAYNTGAIGGTQAYQMPSMAYIGQTAAAQGVNSAAQMLAKFYLDYAKEIFPVCEVDSTTRVTWIIEKSVQLQKHMLKGAE